MADVAPKVDLKNANLAALLAWAVPGLGHIYQGRVGKGILYSVCIGGLYLVGLAMGDWRVVYWRWISPLADPENFRLTYIGQFFVGMAALPGLLQATWHRLGFVDPILWGYLDAPPPHEVNRLYARGKLVEVGSLYTVIAGLLNILAIFDAWEGPALADAAPATATPAPSGVPA